MPRGRPKGSKNKSMSIKVSEDIEDQMNEAVVRIQDKMPQDSVLEGPKKYKRDCNGLLSGINYHFNDDGSVNWRAMIKDEHLFPNKSWFELRKKETPRSISGLKDHQLLIKLSGIKELAKLRGFSSVVYETVKCEQDHVAVSCAINFSPNYETNSEPILFEDMANATFNNTSSFATKFLETIACNRAFVRAVRNFLNVHIVGDDEIDKSDLPSSIKPATNIDSLSPQGLLKQLCVNSGLLNFEDFLNELRSWHTSGKYIFDLEKLDPSSWSSFESIGAKEAREFIKILKN
jgi:hypothetical protein